MTESRIERIVEREMNVLDKAFLNGKMSREQYDREVTALDKWANRQYNALEISTQLYRRMGED